MTGKVCPRYQQWYNPFLSLSSHPCHHIAEDGLREKSQANVNRGATFLTVERAVCNFQTGPNEVAL